MNKLKLESDVLIADVVLWNMQSSTRLRKYDATKVCGMLLVCQEDGIIVHPTSR